MSHLVREESWGTIDLDPIKGHVFVRQDWRYEWRSSPGLPPWTPDEKRTYHHAVDRLIWAHWSLRARVLMKNRRSTAQDSIVTQMATRFPHGLSLSFDVRSVPGQSQWLATVTKVDPNKRPLPQASCAFELRQLHLYNIDVLPHVAKRFHGHDPHAQKNFYVISHEFGHALGYGYSRGKGEESESPHRHYDDVHSIMNIGRRVRSRHLFLITETLARMVPGCDFTAVVGR